MALLRTEMISLSRLFFHILYFEIIILKDRIIEIVIIMRDLIFFVRVFILIVTIRDFILFVRIIIF